jgi:hypothetical protein
MLKDEPEADTTENLVYIYMCFCSNLFSVFEAASLKLQSLSTCATELYDIVECLSSKLEQRVNDRFFGFETKKCIQKLPVSQQQSVSTNFTEALSAAIQYLKKWFDFGPNNPLHAIKCLGLQDAELKFNDISLCVETLKLSEKINVDSLYDEVCIVKTLLHNSPPKQQNSVAERWMEIFQANTELKNLFSLVSFVLSIPPSNAEVERIFSLMGLKWDGCRNNCTVALIKAELQISVNFKLTCREFVQFARDNKPLLRSVRSSVKYND